MCNQISSVVYRFSLSLLLALALVSSPLKAQQPVYLPADIPLDVAQIYQELKPAPEYTETTKNIIRQMIRNHYSDIVLNDSFSGDLLDSFIKNLDSTRIYFTAADIAEFEQYRNQLDNLLEDGDLTPGYLIYNRFQHRMIERLVYSIRQVEDEGTGFDFTLDEALEIDRSKEPWAASYAELKDLWRKRVKSNVLSLKLTDKEIPEVRDLLSKRFRSQLSQVLKTNGLDVYQRYMDAMTMSFDPHTQYYAPRAAENFNMSMRLSLEGIGAVLTTEDEYTKVVSIVTGGPADLAGQLKPSDRIVSVAQGEDGAFVDVVGWRVDDVVQLIRGAKGSVVRLNIIPSAAENSLSTQTISITRDTVKLEDQSAKKEIVEINRDGRNYKLGVIELPTFYSDFEALQNRDENYRSSTRDVHRLLDELKAEGVDGIVMDLRRNGGGSLSEANSLVGLFIRRGPTVQVRNADGSNIVQGDPDPEIVYEGPLAVLVNRLSASASEIFAGAIQDYQRGLILGGQTFGKGTVQELIPMREGQMKITRAKFYRISGESTQHKGVTPDIFFPDLMDIMDDIGESALPAALPWDTIAANYYRPYTDLRALIPSLRELHDARTQHDPDFDYIRAQIKRAEANKDRNELTLNEEKLKREREENDRWRLELENTRRLAKGLEPLKDIAALDETDAESEESLAGLDTDAQLNPEESVSDAAEETDPLLVESGNILLDLIRLQGATAVSVAAKQ
ncbi:MAG: carboxy terminal-processing peptidase [Pseudomonadales bacterium]|nr:carboxy terminal-processing peptidase [Pseudomonadales bacterium]